MLLTDTRKVEILELTAAETRLGDSRAYAKHFTTITLFSFSHLVVLGLVLHPRPSLLAIIYDTVLSNIHVFRDSLCSYCASYHDRRVNVAYST